MRIRSILSDRVKPRKPPWMVVALVVLAAFTAQAQEIHHGIVGCGGERLSDEQLVLEGTVGQAVVGEASDESVLHQIGYWYLPEDSATPVYLVAFLAERTGSRVVVRWRLGSGSSGSSFHVWRQEPQEERVRISEQALTGQSHFEFVDAAAPAGELEYWLQETSEGERWFGPVCISGLPLAFKLDQAQPNPFNPTTSIRYSLPRRAPVRLVIYDVHGRRVRTLVNADQPAGLHTVIWNGFDDRGHAVASGTYFVHLTSSAGRESSKLSLAR